MSKDKVINLQGQNLRVVASINELTGISNIEGLNSVLIKRQSGKRQRLELLANISKDQLHSLNSVEFLKTLKYTSFHWRLCRCDRG